MARREPALIAAVSASCPGASAALLASIARGGMQFMLIIWLQGIWLVLHGYSFIDSPLWSGIYLLPLTAGFLVAGAAGRCRLRLERTELRDLTGEIEWAKVTQTVPEDYPAAAAKAARETPRDPAEIRQVYKVYEGLKRDRGVIDFEDVLLLARYFLALYAAEEAKSFADFEAEALDSGLSLTNRDSVMPALTAELGRRAERIFDTSSWST